MRLITYPSKILTEEMPVIDKNPSDELIKNMRQIMKRNGGVGLAANQVGAKQKFFIAFGRTFVNPEIIQQSGHKTMQEECLSLPNVTLPVTRSTKITLGCRNILPDGRLSFSDEKFTGIRARIIQHEVDHLNGITILDRTGARYKAKHYKKILEKA
jgi:peptide deformylase